MKKFGITNLAAALILLLPTILSAATDKTLTPRRAYLSFMLARGAYFPLPAMIIGWMRPSRTGSSLKEPRPMSSFPWMQGR